MSATKCMERTRREHEDLLAEFNSLMSGVESTLEATGMRARRLAHPEMFLEIKRALNPLAGDTLELFRVAELADNLQTVGEAKQGALMDRLMQSRLRHALRAATQGRGQCTHADVEPEAMIVWDFSAD